MGASCLVVLGLLQERFVIGANEYYCEIPGTTAFSCTKQSACQRRLHIASALSDQVDDGLTAGDAVDHTVGLERGLAILFMPNATSLFG